MASIVSLLSLQAFGIDVVAGGDIQQALEVACNAATPQVIELQTDDQVDWFIGPGGVNGDVLQYPHPTNCPANVPPVTIRGSDGPARIHYQPSGGAVDASLMTFTGGARVTIENLELVGRLTADSADEDEAGSEYARLCAALSDRVRGVTHLSGQLSPGELNVDNVTFRCLDAGPLATGGSRGGAIYARGVPLLIEDSVFDANFGTLGGAVALIPGEVNLGPTTNDVLEIYGSAFLRNQADFGGAVFTNIQSYGVKVYDSNFDLNIGAFGAGGILVDGAGSVEFQRTIFDRQNNGNFFEDQYGGAVAVRRTDDLLFRNNLVCGSWAGSGGGLYAEDAGPVKIQGSVFAECGALCYGGGVFIDEPFLNPVNDIEVTNNTFVGNEAGRPPPFLNDPDLCAVGGGGAAAFWGVNPLFQNNVVAYQQFGGGVLGHYEEFRTIPAYQLGDEIRIYNSIFYENEDANPDNAGHFTGDFASIALHPSNLADVDPQLVYTAVGEYNCAPDAFYPLRTSPTRDAGGGEPTDGVPSDCVDMVDTSPIPDFDHDSPLDNDPSCDMGAFGGDYGLFAKDTDGDGVQNMYDCDDNDATVFPGAQEVCDFIDNDCNGIVDDGIINTWYPDADGDGEGDRDAPLELACAQPLGKVDNKRDCNDENAAINTLAVEVCDNIDNNCNNLDDDGLDIVQWYRDSDGDGYGSVAQDPIEQCSSPGDGFIADQGGDCDDGNANVNPEQREVCDFNAQGVPIDNDCDGLANADDSDAQGVELYWLDADGDTYGDPETVTARCQNEVAPEGFIPFPDGALPDCDDTNVAINPGAMEVCAEIDDEDCDGDVNELDANTVDVAYGYPDADLDGIGNAAGGIAYCNNEPAPAQTVSVFGDCDDNDPLVGECTQGCGGCQSTVPAQGAIGFAFGMLGLMMRRRRA